MNKVFVFIISMRVGGAERVASILANRFYKEGQLELVLMSRDIVYDLPKGLKIHFLTDEKKKTHPLLKILKLPIQAWRFAQLCKENKVSKVISFMYRPNFINVLAAMMGGGHQTIISERGNPNQEKRFKPLVKLLYPKADLIVPNSFGNKHILESDLNIRANYQVIQNPIDFKLINKEVDPIKSSNFVFVTLGRLIPTKHHDILMSAFAELNLEHAELWIVGEGPLMDDLKHFSKTLKVDDRVIFHGGHVYPFTLLKKSAVFLFGSSLEGFPNVVIEALACGLPVISSDCESGPREIMMPRSNVSNRLEAGFEETAYGYLVANHDKEAFKRTMESLYLDSQKRNEFSQNARSRAEDFDSEKILAQFKMILDA